MATALRMDDRLKTFATPRQNEYLAAVNKFGSVSAAARQLGVNESSVRLAMNKLKSNAAKQLYMVNASVSDKLPLQCNESTFTIGNTDKRILVLTDVQAKPGTDFSYLTRIGQYMVDKKPDIVVCIGDFADMPSLSSYDQGKKSFEGRRYKLDIEASHEAMRAFLLPMHTYNATHPEAPYKPRMVLTLGNHEHRIDRAVNDDPKLDGVMSISDLEYEEFGWEVYPFLEVVIIEGIAFSHYFVTGVAGRPAGTAAAQLRKTNMSCIAGHQQGKQIAYGTKADGSTITAIISGSCYLHDENYLGAQGNKHWRGFIMLNEVNDGSFDEMWVTLKYINGKYPHIKAEKGQIFDSVTGIEIK